MGLLRDIKGIFKKDFKLFAAINVIYFGTVIVGAIIALAMPDLQMSLIMAAGQTFGSGSPLGGVGEAYMSGNIAVAAVYTFITNFFLGTLAALTIPSLILPFWAVLMGAYRALLWGIMLVIPVPGIMPLSTVAPHYLTILLEGEAYIVAIFACTRGLVALFKPKNFGTDSRLKAYWQSIKDNGKLLLIVIALLAVAAVYEAWEVTFFAGLAGGAVAGGQFGFYDEEFGAASSYSNWTQNILVNTAEWSSFNVGGGKLMRTQVVTNGTPVDVMIMDRGNLTAFNASPDGGGWSAYVLKKNAVNETFDFIPPQDGTYWVVMRNTGEKDAKIHMQVRYKY
jgi:hypothetical protein